MSALLLWYTRTRAAITAAGLPPRYTLPIAAEQGSARARGNGRADEASHLVSRPADAVLAREREGRAAPERCGGVNSTASVLVSAREPTWAITSPACRRVTVGTCPQWTAELRLPGHP